MCSLSTALNNVKIPRQTEYFLIGDQVNRVFPLDPLER